MASGSLGQTVTAPTDSPNAEPPAGTGGPAGGGPGWEAHDQDGLTLPVNPDPWQAFLQGLEAGIVYGAAVGYRDGVAALDDAAVATAAHRPSRHPSHEELTRRRRTYGRPALTPEQIRARAATSWRLPSRAGRRAS